MCPTITHKTDKFTEEPLHYLCALNAEEKELLEKQTAALKKKKKGPEAAQYQEERNQLSQEGARKYAIYTD